MPAYPQARPRTTMPDPIALQRRARPTLLIVDDQPILAEFMAAVAEEAGWTAVLALGTGEFETIIEESRPDVIALDLAMPGRDGVELLRALASNGFGGVLIIVSACDRAVVEASAKLAREHGLAVTGYSQKPITARAFAELLDQAKATIPQSAFDSRHQAGIAARRSGVDAGHPLGGEARDIMRPAGLGTGAG
jgi:CheY-like chemotaxis protein